MDILILGNGFDIAHGLKTKYSDFLEYCRKQINRIPTYKPTNDFYNNLWIRHFLNVQQKMGDTWIDLEKEIYKVIEYISQLSIINSRNYQRAFIMDFDDRNFDFYNFEEYLENYVYSGSAENGYVRIDPHNVLKFKIYFDNPRGVVNFLYNQLREFTVLFEIYLLDEVLKPLDGKSKFQLSLGEIGVNKGNKDVYVLSFNYTDTCERLYKYKINTHCEINIKPIYVHGKAEKGKSNLVLGTHSFYNDVSTPINQNISVDFNIFKKHNQRHKYGTIEAYQELHRKIKKSNSLPKFHIIGHSLDNTDENILKHILLANSDSVINIYYHNEEAQERLMNKINSIIGEDEVMAKVRFIHQHDKKRGILIPVKEPVLMESP